MQDLAAVCVFVLTPSFQLSTVLLCSGLTADGIYQSRKRLHHYLVLYAENFKYPCFLIRLELLCIRV